MLAKIIDALLKLFNAVFGPRQPLAPATPSYPDTESEPQDAADLDHETDHSIVVIEDLQPILHRVSLTESPTIRMHQDTNPEDIDLNPAAANTSPKTSGTEEKGYLWCLDNGHGKLTEGKQSPVFDDGFTRFFEYEFNRDIVRRIAEKLDALQIAYFIVVPEIETGNLLEERVNRANNYSSDLPKLFVSVHANAGPVKNFDKDWSTASGIETWYHHNSEQGQKMAAIFQDALIRKTGWKDRKIKSKTTKQFYVLRKTTMTAILTENGFYNNKTEAKLLMDDGTRQKIADAHVAAIEKIEQEGL